MRRSRSRGSRSGSRGSKSRGSSSRSRSRSKTRKSLSAIHEEEGQKQGKILSSRNRSRSRSKSMPRTSSMIKSRRYLEEDKSVPTVNSPGTLWTNVANCSKVGACTSSSIYETPSCDETGMNSAQRSVQTKIVKGLATSRMKPGQKGNEFHPQIVLINPPRRRKNHKKQIFKGNSRDTSSSSDYMQSRKSSYSSTPSLCDVSTISGSELTPHHRFKFWKGRR